jgi:hypothetical protein
VAGAGEGGRYSARTKTRLHSWWETTND